MNTMRIMILGGDGFCGWATALHLSSLGHEVTIVDNLSRRRIDHDLGVESLTPIASLEQRVERWYMEMGERIEIVTINVARDIKALHQLISHTNPGAIIHFAQQRAAPFSMKTMRHKMYTIDNNVNATHNVLAILADLKSDTHLIHLGTMGVYGYGSTDGEILPEGYLQVVPTRGPRSDDIFGPPREIRYPTNPGSVYHMTKCLDAEMFAYYAKNDHLRITDLHQGIVWGTMTDPMLMHEELINRFDYDGDYGTVLNRFIVQGAIGYPLTVHGTGGQTRAFIHIRDSVRCIELALENPPQRGERVKIFNQMTETHRVYDLARHCADLTGADMQMVDNPRNEAAANTLNVDNHSFIDLGLKPTLLNDALINEVHDIVDRFKSRIDTTKIPCTSRWVK
jgi:Nucleoside-diphosphate-sugar epimerases